MSSSEEGYLLTIRQGLYRLQCYGNQELSRDTMNIQKSKGMSVVAVTEEDLQRFFKELEKKAV